MSTVSSSALLGCLVDLDVLDDQVACVKTLRIGVCLSILEETEDELGRLDRPSCAGDTELLSCRDIPSASSQASPDRGRAGDSVAKSYPVQHVQFHQHIFSSELPPCALVRSQGT